MTLTKEENVRLDDLAMRYQSASGQQREILLLRMVELLGKINQLSTVSAIRTMSDGEIVEQSALHYAILKALDGFDSAKGSFVSRFFVKYAQELRAARQEYALTKDNRRHSLLREYIKPLTSELYAYRERNFSQPLSQPLSRIQYRVMGTEQIENVVWYEIVSRKETVYIPQSENLFHSVYTSEQLPVTEGDDGEKTELELATPEMDTGGIMTTEQLDSYVLPLAATVLQMYGKGRSGDKGSLTKYELYRLIYTDYLIKALKALAEEGRYQRGYYHETKLLSVAVPDWRDHLLESTAGDFSSIIATAIRRIDDILHNGDQNEIPLPAPFAIRGPYLTEHYKIRRSMEGLKVAVSECHSAFLREYRNNIYQTYN